MRPRRSRRAWRQRTRRGAEASFGRQRRHGATKSGPALAAQRQRMVADDGGGSRVGHWDPADAPASIAGAERGHTIYDRQRTGQEGERNRTCLLQFQCPPCHSLLHPTHFSRSQLVAALSAASATVPLAAATSAATRAVSPAATAAATVVVASAATAMATATVGRLWVWLSCFRRYV